MFSIFCHNKQYFCTWVFSLWDVVNIDPKEKDQCIQRAPTFFTGTVSPWQRVAAVKRQEQRRAPAPTPAIPPAHPRGLACSDSAAAAAHTRHWAFWPRGRPRQRALWQLLRDTHHTSASAARSVTARWLLPHARSRLCHSVCYRHAVLRGFIC